MREKGIRSDNIERGEVTQDRDQISVFDIIGIIVRRRWIIIVITAAATVFSFLLLLYSARASSKSWNPFPNIFLAKARVLIGDSSQSSSLSSVLSQSNLSALSGLLGMGSAAGASSSANLAISFLKDANFIKDAIANEFDFTGRYGLLEMVKTKSRAIFSLNLTADFSATTKILSIGYTDMDPEFATLIVNRIVELLAERFTSLSLETVIKKKEYLEQSIAAVQEKSDIATQKLIAFKLKYGIAGSSLEGNTDFTTSNTQKIAQLEAQLFSKQIDMKLQRDYLPESDPRIVRLKNEIEFLRKTIDDLNKGSTEFSDAAFNAGQFPDLVVQYVGLSRDAQVQTAILTLLTQQYETAKLEAMGTTQIFQVIEMAEVPEVRFKPNRTKIVMVMCMVGFALSLFAAFIVEFVQKTKQDPVEGEKLQAIKRMLSFGKKARRG